MSRQILSQSGQKIKHKGDREHMFSYISIHPLKNQHVRNNPLSHHGIPGTSYLIAPVFPLWPRAFSSGTRLGISSKWLMNSSVSSGRWSAAIHCPYGKWDTSDPEATCAVRLSQWPHCDRCGLPLKRLGMVYPELRTELNRRPISARIRTSSGPRYARWQGLNHRLVVLAAFLGNRNED